MTHVCHCCKGQYGEPQMHRSAANGKWRCNDVWGCDRRMEKLARGNNEATRRTARWRPGRSR